LVGSLAESLIALAFSHGWESPPPSPLHGLLDVLAFNSAPDPSVKNGSATPTVEDCRCVQLLQAAQAKDLATKLPADEEQLIKTVSEL
jgi:hypothetical protein